MMMRLSILCSVLALASCTVGDGEDENATSGASVGTVDQHLSGCHGHASSSIPADGKYVLTTFGGPGDHQAMSCGGFADGSTWYAASRQRYGCGAHLQMQANGACVVVEAQDYGPDVCVENAAGMPVLDASPLVAKALFDSAEAGWSDHMVVTVTEVPATTPLGMCQDGGGGGGGGGGASCASSTLDRDVADGTCVQSESDAAWYQCTNGTWASIASSAGCATAYGYCDSPTLGTSVPPRTCVQSAASSKWFQCNGQGWVTPVDVASQTGPIGACASMHAL